MFTLPTVFIFFFFLGTAIGSFLNAWIWRMYAGKSIVHGRSMCPHCQHQLAWYDNLPLLSFILLRGRCRYCQQAISVQYPLVEFCMGGLFVFLLFFYENNSEFLFASGALIRDAIILSLLVVIFIFDLRYREIWDRTTMIPAALLYVASLLFSWQSWDSMLVGALLGGGFFLLQFLLSKGRWIGGGDIRLGVFMGVILGWPLIGVALFLAYIIGAVVSILLILFKRLKLASETPFGTYLTVATFLTMFWGEELLEWYLGLLGF